MSEDPRLKPLQRETVFTLHPLSLEDEGPMKTVTPSPIVNTDSGLDLLKRLSSAPSLYSPDTSALDKQSAPRTEKKD